MLLQRTSKHTEKLLNQARVEAEKGVRWNYNKRQNESITVKPNEAQSYLLSCIHNR